MMTPSATAKAFTSGTLGSGPTVTTVPLKKIVSAGPLTCGPGTSAANIVAAQTKAIETANKRVKVEPGRGDGTFSDLLVISFLSLLTLAGHTSPDVGLPSAKTSRCSTRTRLRRPTTQAHTSRVPATAL
jgi:hypothetical protein